MKNNKVILILLITVIMTIVLRITGLTYAYFIVSPAHSDSSSISLDIANLGNIVFTDGNQIKVDAMLPGKSYTKTFTVSRINSNINVSIKYAVKLYVTSNTLTSVANSQFLYLLSGSTNGSGTVNSK